MKISFIGMSGVGKTFWSKQFEKHGFKRFGCDDLIEQKLQPELKKQGFKGIADVAKWMGQPYENRHGQNSKKYLQYEEEVVKEIINYVKNAPDNEDIAVDTTGSIIYIDKRVLHALARHTKIIYLRTPAFVKKQMYQQFLQNPKPIVWGNVFKKQKSESNNAALARCYENLLEQRSGAYENFAYLIMSYRTHQEKEYNVESFLQTIQTYDQL